MYNKRAKQHQAQSGVNKQNTPRWNGHAQFGVTKEQHVSFDRFVCKHSPGPQQYNCERWPYTAKLHTNSKQQQQSNAALPSYANLYHCSKAESNMLPHYQGTPYLKPKSSNNTQQAFKDVRNYANDYSNYQIKK